MELLPEGKNFRLVHEDEFPSILEFLEQFLPHSLKIHQTIKTFVNDHVWDFYFYVCRQWPEQPVILHFPGMTCSPNSNIYESFSVFCPCDQLDNLQLLEEEDILIDWSKPIYLNFTHKLIMERIEEFYSKRGTLEKVSGDIYVCEEPPAELNFDQLPPDVELRQLTAENAQTIHDLYPANDMECVEVFEKLIKQLPAYGVFSSSGELAAWMVQSYYGAMFSMQTKPEFRRKGYGIYLAQYLTKIVTDRGYLPFVVIRPENDASKSLYTKLGFKKNYETVRAILRPHSENGDANESPGGGETNGELTNNN
ncbi:glycine N-acyltransferase [Chrysoperla carnea]|uniref:glycine N-acyltransferase n=1 Tax=Chrysoperla carnea TaxID=189513 RepID=UPI001D05D002|nr:glycine N-acyltransferase [Chrysoperla carnea]